MAGRAANRATVRGDEVRCEAEAPLVEPAPDASGARHDGLARLASWVGSGGAVVAVARGARRIELPLPPAREGERAWLRVAVVGAPLDATVRFGGSAAARTLHVEPRAHLECLDWIALGERPAGATQVTIETDESAPAWRLDALALRLDRAPPAEGHAAWRARDGALEVRAAPGARVADPEWTLKLLAEQVAAVEALLERRFDGPIALIALPAGAAEFEASGGFQNGRALFLRDDELHLPWRGYAHELFHVFEEERGLQLPWSWSEGLACALALEVADATVAGIEGPARHRAALAALRRDGDEFHRPGAASVNRLLPLAAPPADRRERDAAYAWATALVEEVARRGGRGAFARFVAAWEAGSGAGGARAIAALEAAAGGPLDDLRARCGVGLVPP
ncbi:MAG: hypothetical protein JNL90_18165 [Planctomycetes bacterium]|nr:hypothetical protein [Planctomycetota bacterium]